MYLHCIVNSTNILSSEHDMCKCVYNYNLVNSSLTLISSSYKLEFISYSHCTYFAT